MRCLAFVSAIGFIAVCSCDGDSSALMSVWNDGGQAGAAGGQGGPGGQIVPATGGAGGGGGSVSGGGTIVVPGGTRDLATTRCISASGGSCPVASNDITCLEVNCGPDLTACYYSDGVSAAAGGICQSYANCMLACKCDGSSSTCEYNCYQNHASTVPDCSNCLYKLAGCASNHGCSLLGTC